MATKSKKSDPLFNAFTKSYKLRLVVHAATRNAKKTLCGRDVEKLARFHFDPEVEGSCRRCIRKMEINDRIHPGWDE